MINLFNMASNDQSLYYLGQVFGFVGNVLPVTTAPMILGVMFKTFNSIVLTVAVLIVVYVTVVGVIKTAHEGQMMGNKNWSNLWIPIRMVIGIAALVPTPSGYSAIQIVIMWIVVQGIAAADTIWTTVLNYTNVMGSPISTVSIPSVGIGNNFQTLFASLVCQESARQTAPITSSGSLDGGYYCHGNPRDSFCQLSDDSSGILNISGGQTSHVMGTSTTLVNGVQTTINTPAIQYPMGPNGACGTLTYCDVDAACADTSTLDKQIRCNACTAQKTALQNSVSVLGGIAAAFVNADVSYRSFYDTPGAKPPAWVASYCSANNISSTGCCPALLIALPPGFNFPGQSCALPSNFNSGDTNNASASAVTTIYWPFALKPTIGNINFIQATTNNYTSAISNAVQQTIQQAVNNTNTTDQTLQTAQQNGWIFAGAFYYYLAKSNDKNVDAAIPSFTVSGRNPLPEQSANPLYNTRNNFDAAAKLVSYLTTQGQISSSTASLPPQLQDLSKLSDGLASSAASIMNAFMTIVSGGQAGQAVTNPLASLQTLGYVLLIIAQALFAVIVVAVTTLTIVGYLDVFVLGTGVDNPVGPTVTTLAIIFAPIFALLLGALFTFGGLLAIYTPLIPYIVFTMGAITWFILVIEAMIAAPLVALGILSPQGEHELLGKSGHAIGLIFSIFLRPGLMIFGMIAAMLLSIVVVTMINAGFIGVMGQIITNPGLVELILFICAYVSIVLTALNKCFSLIYLVPDGVLRWIGIHGGEGGASAAQEALTGARGGVEAGVGQVRGAGQQAVGRGEVAGKNWQGVKETAAKGKTGPEIKKGE